MLWTSENLVFRAGSPAHRFTWNTIEALAIMLRRLAYPSRLIDLSLLFGVNYATICTIFNEMIERLYNKYNEGIRYNKKHLNSFNLRVFNDAIIEKGSPYRDVVGFIGGTINVICRPIEHQEVVYNGHIRAHGLKYQGIVCPDGITVSLAGPFVGAMHDQRMLDTSEILSCLENDLDCRSIGGKLYALYGDPAYRESSVIIKPIRGVVSRDERRLNYLMSTVRECVEWEFGHVATLFAFLKFRPGQKLLLSRVGMLYVVATLFKNIHACINGRNQTSSYFAVNPPDRKSVV